MDYATLNVLTEWVPRYSREKSVRETNTYGPRDNFSRATSHVILATIRRCLDDPEARRVSSAEQAKCQEQAR